MKDSDLNTLFKNLRAAESRSVPPFDHLARTPEGSRPRSIRLVPVLSVVAGFCLIVLTVTLRPWQPKPDPTFVYAFPGDSVTQSLSDMEFSRYEADSEAIVQLVDADWASPTAFLLDLDTSAHESS